MTLVSVLCDGNCEDCALAMDLNTIEEENEGMDFVCLAIQSGITPVIVGVAN